MGTLDDLQARFKPRFLASARQRLQRANDHTGEPDVVVAELHALAGDASLLGFAAISQVARAGEAAGKRWRAGEGDAAREECLAALREAAARVEELSAPRPQGAVLARPLRLEELYRRALARESVSVVTHELRNKLGSIRNAAFYLRRKLQGASDDARVPQFFELIEGELAGAEKTISERIPELPEAPAPEARERWDASAAVVELLAALAAPSGVTLAVAASPPHTCLGDRRELELALFCLVENAVEAVAGAGGGKVTVGATAEGDDRVVITVDDEGPGLDQAAAARALEPLFTNKPGRLGLGLNIARRMVGRSQGTLSLGPRPGRGARACLLLGRAT